MGNIYNIPDVCYIQRDIMRCRPFICVVCKANNNERLSLELQA